MNKAPRRAKIYADFNNADPEGRIRLNVRGSHSDLQLLGPNLAEGLEVDLESEDLRCVGILEKSASEDIWVARIDWRAVKERDE